MYGAILGDMIGAPYEFDMGNKSKEFPLFCKQSQFTDDSVMIIYQVRQYRLVDIFSCMIHVECVVLMSKK